MFIEPMPRPEKVSRPGRRGLRGAGHRWPAPLRPRPQPPRTPHSRSPDAPPDPHPQASPTWPPTLASPAARAPPATLTLRLPDTAPDPHPSAPTRPGPFAPHAPEPCPQPSPGTADPVALARRGRARGGARRCDGLEPPETACARGLRSGVKNVFLCLPAAAFSREGIGLTRTGPRQASERDFEVLRLFSSFPNWQD